MNSQQQRFENERKEVAGKVESLEQTVVALKEIVLKQAEDIGTLKLKVGTLEKVVTMVFFYSFK